MQFFFIFKYIFFNIIYKKVSLKSQTFLKDKTFSMKEGGVGSVLSNTRAMVANPIISYIILGAVHNEV